MPSRPLLFPACPLRADRLGGPHIYRRKPVVAIRPRATYDPEELLGKLMRDGPGGAVLDQDAIDGADRGDLRGGAGEENLVRDVEDLARQRLLDNRDAEMARQREDRVAGDAAEHGVGQ